MLANLVIAELGGSREDRANVWRLYYDDVDSIWTESAAREAWIPPDRES